MVSETKVTMKVSHQLSTVRVLAFAAAGGVFAFLFAPVISISPAIAQQITNTTTAGGIPETADLPQQLLVAVDNEPFYQSISGNLASMRIVDVSSSLVTREGSFVETAFMRNIGNVTNTGTYIENVNHNIGIAHSVGKGIITTENGGGDVISWNAYDLGLLSGYGSGNRNGNDTAAGLDSITTYRGIVFFNTDSERLSFMNNIVGLYITQVNNENGSSLRQIWEWKNN